jgi:hypothetical protein
MITSKARNFLFLLGSLYFVFLTTPMSSASAQDILRWPTDSTAITSVMGHRNLDDPPGASRNHGGVDIGVPDGTPVYAAHNAQVVKSGPSGNEAGTRIQLLSPDGGIETRYFHLSSVGVSVGQSVSKGDTIGLSGSTGNVGGPHLHYELKLRSSSGALVRVDPASAQGQDLSNPSVVSQLITEGQQISAGGASGSNSVGGNLGPAPTGGGSGTGGGGTGPATGGASASDPSCSTEILSTGKQLAESNMNVEKQMIDEAISKPTSVMELTCFDQFGEMFNSEIGAIFGNTQDDSITGVGLAEFGFADTFTDTQAAIGNEIIGGLTGGLFGSRGNTIGDMISTQVQSAISSVMGSMGGGGGNVQFQCEAMNLLWEIMQCEDILDFKIPSLQDLIGDIGLGDALSGLRPDSCAGEALYDAALGAADRVFTAHQGDLPDALMPSTLESTLSRY